MARSVSGIVRRWWAISDSRDNVEAVRRPGRPRSAQAERAILDATLTLLVEAGYEGMSIEGVAVKAGVGKATIYRWWSNKEELVADALRTLNADVEAPDTGNVRDDLVTLARGYQRATVGSIIGPMVARLIGAAVSNPELLSIFMSSVGLTRRQAVRRILERAQARGEVRSDIDIELFVDMIIGPLLIRALVYGSEAIASPDLLDQLVDVLLHGVAVSDR